MRGWTEEQCPLKAVPIATQTLSRGLNCVWQWLEGLLPFLKMLSYFLFSRPYLSLIDSNFQQNNWIRKQECIPVGCVPPAHYRTGVSLTETPLDRDPLLDRDLSWIEMPPWAESPLDRNPPDRDPPGQRPPDKDLPEISCTHRNHTV